MPLALFGQGTPLLRLTTIQTVAGGPVQFTFQDQGTAATNYVVEVAPAVTGNWSNLPGAIVTSLGGGRYRVNAPDPLTPNAFFRVRTLGGTAITASFATTAFQVNEGGAASPTITFSAPLFGIVRYTVGGTATSGDYVNLSGEVFVNGTSATIPVSLRDNQNIGQLRYLTLTLEAGPGYRLTGNSQATINIHENDAEWQGSFISDTAILGFVLRIQESNGTKVATLKSDGLGLFPITETPASLTFSANEFSAAASSIAVPPNATLLNEPMSLSLTLSAMNGVPNQQVSATEVRGSASLISAVPARPHLNVTNAGTFLLFKPAVTPSTNQVELVSAP